MSAPPPWDGRNSGPAVRAGDAGESGKKRFADEGGGGKEGAGVVDDCVNARGAKGTSLAGAEPVGGPKEKGLAPGEGLEEEGLEDAPGPLPPDKAKGAKPGSFGSWEASAAGMVRDCDDMPTRGLVPAVEGAAPWPGLVDGKSPAGPLILTRPS